MHLLSDFFKLKRRYSRSVNLERDLEIADSVLGYTPTTRSIDMLNRFLTAYTNSKTVRSWTLTGVFGTGKSAFAHFLACLCAPHHDPLRENALTIANQIDIDSELIEVLNNDFPQRGFIKAVVTAQREPISHTVVKALYRGVNSFWGNQRGAKPSVFGMVKELLRRVNANEKINSDLVLNAIKDTATASNSGVLLIIDELGKSLEYASQFQEVDDLFLLQQIAELPSGDKDPKVFLLGLLHQSFADYAHGLSVAQRNEWGKIQGRFEDIPFIESPEQMMRLIGQAIDKDPKFDQISTIKQKSVEWERILKNNDGLRGLTAENIYNVYPLHPISALVLPVLSSRYAQNDRTVFTFLSSSEPHSFSSFLAECYEENTIPLLKIHKLYDYFVESVGISMSSRPQLQRWIEIQDRIFDARNLEPDAVSVLKTIGILNLISITGSLRASRELVTVALCNDPNNINEQKHWEAIIDLLINRGLITQRRQIGELRIWEGSDFDVENELSKQIDLMNESVADLLNKFYPLTPVVAQRHSYQSGTLRYYERVFCDNIEGLINLRCNDDNSDGLICYWINDRSKLQEIPDKTEDGKPIVVVCASNLRSLKLSVYEYIALRNIYEKTPQLQSDGVARREVSQRLIMGKRLLEDTLFNSLNQGREGSYCFFQGKHEPCLSGKDFNSKLSDIFDEVYIDGIHLWNELINRHEITSQVAKARRELFEAMLINTEKEKFGIVGYGPERSIYESLFGETGIHRFIEGTWVITDPYEDYGITTVWAVIERFCTSETSAPRNVKELYDLLEKPPYGVRKALIPLLFLAVLLKHSDDVSLYFNGTFIPVIGSEHLELLVKNPDRFAIKFFEISGVRAELFRELYEIVKRPSVKATCKVRNQTLLGIVKPLVRFVSTLPSYSLKTEEISAEAKLVRKQLLQAKEPEVLLFKALPEACGLKSIELGKNADSIKTFRNKLVLALQELRTAYDKLLSSCEQLIHQAFAIRSDVKNLREDLRVRARYLIGQCIEPRLKSFLIAVVDESVDHRSWLESILMVIADKPAEAWTDLDAVGFELKLSEIARRFVNLDALRVNNLSGRPGEGFEAKRVTITNFDGTEINDMLWLHKEEKGYIEKIIDKLFEDESLKNDSRLQKAIAALLIEKNYKNEKVDTKIKGIRNG